MEAISFGVPRRQRAESMHKLNRKMSFIFCYRQTALKFRKFLLLGRFGCELLSVKSSGSKNCEHEWSETFAWRLCASCARCLPDGQSRLIRTETVRISAFIGSAELHLQNGEGRMRFAQQTFPACRAPLQSES